MLAQLQLNTQELSSSRMTTATLPPLQIALTLRKGFAVGCEGSYLITCRPVAPSAFDMWNLRSTILDPYMWSFTIMGFVALKSKRATTPLPVPTAICSPVSSNLKAVNGWSAQAGGETNHTRRSPCSDVNLLTLGSRMCCCAICFTALCLLLHWEGTPTSCSSSKCPMLHRKNTCNAMQE